MKWILLILLVFEAGVANAQFINETFEGAGTPSNWFKNGSANFDYTTSPLDGAQSLRCNSATSDSAGYNPGASLNNGEIWGKLLVRIDTLPSAAAKLITAGDSGYGGLVGYYLNSWNNNRSGWLHGKRVISRNGLQHLVSRQENFIGRRNIGDVF